MPALRQPNWTRILTILLVILASFAILYVSFSVLLRFTQVIVLFVLGGIAAYMLTPLVNSLHVAFRARWLAVILAYGMVAVGLFALGFWLFTPFIDQSKSLISNLHDPSAASLQGITRVRNDALHVQHELATERQRLPLQPAMTRKRMQTIETDIMRLQIAVDDLRRGIVSARSELPTTPASSHPRSSTSRPSPNPKPQTKVPPSYVALVDDPVTLLSQDYTRATQNLSAVDSTALKQAYSEAQNTRLAAQNLYHIMSTTPILLLRAQAWLDQHHIRIDLHDKFGQAARQLSNQGTNLLNNAIAILSETANILLDITLVLIISFYLLNDGGRIARSTIGLVPTDYRQQVAFFGGSLDKVLGGYIRGQLFLALLSGILGGGGAAFLGVPYPLLIGITTALLQLVPVIGPMISAVPAVIISLFFAPVTTTVILLVWFLIFQQVVTNVIGPRIMGLAVGIHPLEALLAVLVGYPLGGLLGAFLAVPVAGVLHLLVSEAYAYFVLGRAFPADEGAASPAAEAVPAAPAPEQRKTGSAAP